MNDKLTIFNDQSDAEALSSSGFNSIETEEKKLEELQKIGTSVRVISASKTLLASSDYDAEDVMAESATTSVPWIFDLNSVSGYIEKAVALCSTTALTPRLTLYLLNEYPTCELDDDVANTCPAVTSADSYVGKIDFPAMEDLGTGMSNTLSTISTVGNLPLPFYAASKKLYGVLVTRDAITGEAAGMSMILNLQVRED